MAFNFTPLENQEAEIKVPYIEDARSDFAPYYSSTLSIDRAKQEVVQTLALLHATGYFVEGDFQVGKYKRRGYVLHFNLGQAKGRLTVAGLPVRQSTPKKLDQVRVQALLNLRDWLKGAITQQVFTPGANPLVPFLLIGDRTITEAIIEDGRMPLLVAPKYESVEQA